MPDNEKQFEQDIESFLISPAGGWQKASNTGFRIFAPDLDPRKPTLRFVRL